MKKKFLLALLLFEITGCANKHSAPLAPNDLPDSSALGAYIGKLRLSQRGVHEMLDYCAAKFPEARADTERAKETWDSRNAYMIDSEAQVTRSWFLHAGVEEKDIPTLMALLEQAFGPYKDFNPATMAIKTLESQTPDKRMQTCGLYTGFVIGGGQDIRIVDSRTQAFYEKYSSDQ